MNGAAPGPAPARPAAGEQLAAEAVELADVAPAEAAQEGPEVDGAFTVQPSTLAVPPARNAAASSMHSPPASAEAMRVSSFVAGVRPPRRVTEVAVGELLQTEMLGERGREEQPRIGYQAVVVEGDVYPLGVARW